MKHFSLASFYEFDSDIPFDLDTLVPETDLKSHDQSSRNAAEPPVGLVSAPDGREKSDAYSNVLFRISEGWRVIVCEHGMQWILQKRKGSHNGMPEWRGVSYVRSKVGLRRFMKERVFEDRVVKKGRIFERRVQDIPPEVEAQLAQLPERI